MKNFLPGSNVGIGMPSETNSTSRMSLHDGLREPLIRDAPSSSFSASNEHRRNRNIDFVLLYSFLIFAGRSMWSQTVLSAYIYLLRDGDTEAVGLITAIMGISQLVVSFPAGALADRYRRDLLLRASSLVGTAAVVATVLALRTRSYGVLAVALATWGCFWGLAYTCVSALFADSIEDGDRSYWFTRRTIVIKVGGMMGPATALVMFAILGDSWTVQECSFVMTCGQCLCMPAILLLCFMSDDHSLSNIDVGGEDVSTDNDLESSSDESNTEAAPPSSGICFCLSYDRCVPALVAFADVLGGIAAGMSIRYFPIFFLNNLQLGPVIVQVLYILSPACQIPLSILAQRGAKRFGRCQMTVGMKWIGVCLFVGVILSYKANLPRWLTCALWIGRTSCINSTSALTKSIIMDAVPKSERGKWSALESLNMFSWSGSAFLGGILVEHWSILFNFSITSFLQFVATLPLLFIMGRVQDEGQLASTDNAGGGERAREVAELDCGNDGDDRSAAP